MMHPKPLIILAAAIAVCATVSPQLASAAGSGTLTNEIYNDAGSAGNYTNASSITVPSTLATDILFGASALATNYVGGNEAAGGTTAPLTDGQTASSPSNLGNASTNPNEGTSASNALFDLGGAQPWYVEYQLASPVNLTSVIVTSGHQDARLNQAYDILVSTDGTTFTSLSDGSTTTALAASGTGFSYSASTAGHGGAAQSTVSPISGSSLATNVNYIEFVDKSAGADIYRELSATGTTVPEPTCAFFVAASAGLFSLRRNRRTA